MWSDGAAITKQLSDEDVERAARRGMRRTFLDDLPPDARERLEEIRGQIDRGEIAHRRMSRDGRPATDEERRRIHRRRDPMRAQVRKHSKADRIAEALRARPDESYATIAASLGVSHSYLKQVARAEGLRRHAKARRILSVADDPEAGRPRPVARDDPARAQGAA